MKSVVAALALVAIGAGRPVQPAAFARVAVAIVDVHADSSAKSPSIGQARYGTALPIRDVTAEWCHVWAMLGSVRIDGYVPSADVARVTDAGTAGMTIEPMPVDVRPRNAGAGISVAVDAPGIKTIWLDPAPTRVVPIGGALPTLETLAGSPALGDALAGSTPLASVDAPTTWVWLVPARPEPAAVPGDRPEFTAIFNDVPGLPIDDFAPVVVRLITGTDDWRVVSAIGGRADAPVRDESDWVIATGLRQSVVPGVQPQLGARGYVTLRPSGRLPPGDYAVVLRPFYAKPYVPRRIFGRTGEGAAFASVWTFRVK